MAEPLLELTRGPLIDAIHRGDIAVVRSDGELICGVGVPADKLAFWRSSAKPFQALPIVASGAYERWKLSAEDLALIAGSHSGEPAHVDRAQALIAAIGAAPSDLVCGVHPPLNPAAAAGLCARGVEPTVLHNNCSGKHIGMLALADQLGASRAGYYQLDHPVQREIRRTLAAFAGLAPDQIVVGVDGCGVPCFGTSIYHMALAFARLMRPQDTVSGPLAAAAAQVRAAITAHPHLVAGTGRLDTELMRVGEGSLVSKGGACGVQCVGLDDGIGLAIKVEDGAAPTVPGSPPPAVAIEALRQLGALSDEAVRALQVAAVAREVENVRGEPVGEVRPVFELSYDRSQLRHGPK